MRTVLVIDDDPKFRGLVGEILRDHGWNVTEAENGETGIQAAKTQQPEVVLCDLLMSPCNGFQVCQALREFKPLAHTRIAIVSGRDFESDRLEARAAGADEYLTKPIQPDKLLGMLTRLAGAREASPVAASSVDPEPATSLRVKFWGVRGSIATPGAATVQYGGNTSCLEVRAGKEIIILDAGTGLRLLGRALIEEFGEQPLDLTLLLTHTHWDHIQGLPFFIPIYKPQNRLRVLGYEGARLGLETVLRSQMESPFFPIGLRELPANVRIEELKALEFTVGPVRVQTCFAYHPGICVGYRLSAGGFSLAFFPDNELRHPARGSLPPAAEFARAENQKLTDFLRGVDLLIMDTQYDQEEYRQHIGWGHGCVDEVVALALEAQAKRLFLFHHDPDHDDAKITEMTAHARQLVQAQHGALQVEAAQEGLTVELRPEKETP